MHRRILDTLLNTEGGILVACHRTPDGDTLGAGLAVFLWLKGLGKAVRIHCADPVPGVYAFLPGAGELTAEWGAPPAVLVAVDCASPDRIHPEAESLMKQAGLVVNIDHHATNPRYGALNLVMDGAGSTSELIAEMLLDGGQRVTPAIADCLYTGIATDTGQFSFDYTRPESLRAAARLMECGAAFEAICARVFRRRTLSKTRLIASALSSLRLYAGGRVAVLSVPQAALIAAGATSDECENVVNYAVEIDGVEIGILLRETRDGDWKVSLRASGAANVAAIAREFGGGGHVKASGCTVKGALADAERAVTDAAVAAIAKL
jgi:phosphoesterase RecJ-like protein